MTLSTNAIDMSIAESKTRTAYPLSRKKIFKKTLADAIVWFFILSFLLGAGLSVVQGLVSSISLTVNQSPVDSISFVPTSLILFIVAWVVVTFFSYLYQVWYFNTYYYELTPNEVVIRKNPITPKEITMPYERLQDVYVDQDIIDRIFGLYDVHISSATNTSGYLAHIDGVEKPAADGLRDQLLNTIKQRLQKTNSSQPSKEQL